MSAIPDTGPGTGPGTRARGRPRSEAARQAILGAAADLLLARGVSAVSMDAVAERAGVSKATIYRWWPSKETLALDALYQQWATPDAEPPDTGTLRADLLALLLPWIRRAGGQPYGRIVGALITEARTDPTFGAVYRERFVEPRRALARSVFTQAQTREEIPPGTDVEAAIDVLYGALYHRLLHGHAPLTQEFAATVVEIVVAGIRDIQDHLSERSAATVCGRPHPSRPVRCPAKEPRCASRSSTTTTPPAGRPLSRSPNGWTWCRPMSASAIVPITWPNTTAPRSASPPRPTSCSPPRPSAPR